MRHKRMREAFPSRMKKFILAAFLAAAPLHAESVNLSGIYPSLSFFNNEGECGAGAFVP